MDNMLFGTSEKSTKVKMKSCKKQNNAVSFWAKTSSSPLIWNKKK